MIITCAEILDEVAVRVLLAESTKWCVDFLGGIWVEVPEEELGWVIAGTRFINSHFVKSSHLNKGWVFDRVLDEWVPPVPMPEPPELCTWNNETESWDVYTPRQRMYHIWPSVPKDPTAHTVNACGNSEDFMIDLPPEILQVVIDVNTNIGDLVAVLRHVVFHHEPGQFFLAFTAHDMEPFESAYGVEAWAAKQEDVKATHPYVSLWSREELERNLAEWEWTGAALSNTEWQTELSSKCLDILGVSPMKRAEYLTQQSGPVAQFLIDMSKVL